MRYTEFKASIQKHLQRHRRGATWSELREKLSLPYDRPCPEWTRRLEKEIGLSRRKSSGRALIWQIPSTAAHKAHIDHRPSPFPPRVFQ